MDFQNFDDEMSMKRVWNSVRIARSVPYSLFTFGVSDLEYYLVLKPQAENAQVKIRKGEIKITKPLIVRPGDASLEFQDFYESEENDSLVQFLMSRTAAFSNLKLTNHAGKEEIVSDQVEEVVDRLNQKLDREDEDRIAILVAPEALAGVALIRYAAERIISSAPENLTELREKGFLP
ncbi:MAG TPA: hypothetical protein DD473_07300 [Planctomycetaceae bacterium]|nr:hypothetical protein [Planctomycetaceae bacterium]